MELTPRIGVPRLSARELFEELARDPGLDPDVRKRMRELAGDPGAILKPMPEVGREA